MGSGDGRGGAPKCRSSKTDSKITGIIPGGDGGGWDQVGSRNDEKGLNWGLLGGSVH